MAGPVKQLHYDGQPFRRLQELVGVVARGSERLLASDEGGEFAAARQSAIHDCTLTGAVRRLQELVGWLRRRSVCWRATKEANPRAHARQSAR